MRCRHMCWDLAIATVAVLGLVTVHGPAGETKQAPTYATPKDAFEAAKKAAEKNDYKAVVGTLTKDSRDTLAGAMVIMGSFAKVYGAKFAKTDEQKANIQQIEKILDKHGVSADMAKEAVELGLATKSKSQAEVLPAMRKLGASIKDEAGLVAAMMTLAEKDKKAKGNPFDDLKTAKLKGVKIEGDNAKGTIIVTKDGTEKSEPMEFRKEGAGWKIKLDLNTKK